MHVPLPDTDIQDLKAMAVQKFHNAAARSPQGLLATIPQAHPVSVDNFRSILYEGTCTVPAKAFASMRLLNKDRIYKAFPAAV